MSRAAGLALGVMVVLVAGLWLLREGPAPTPADADTTGVERHDFLEGLPLDEGGYALLLHEQATGDGLRVVRDAAALKAAQGQAYYTDNPGAQLKRTLLSILFLSPPGMPPDGAFVTVLKDKQRVETYRCYRAFCAGTEAFDPPHERDMAGLVEASEPVELVTERFDHHDAARGRMFKLMQDPEVALIEPADLPAPGTIVFPQRVRLSLPAILLETDETGHAARVPLDQDTLEARFAAAFAHVFPETDAYRLNPMRVSEIYPPQPGWPVVGEDVDGYLRDPDGDLRGLDGIMVIEPSLTVDLTERMVEALQAEDAFAAMPEFAPPEPPFVADRLAEMAEAHLGRPCPDCFRIELPVATVEGIRVDRLDPPSFTLAHYRIAPQ
ncbi:hypothetical protein [Roseovarius atlanticus]|uniref:hypothetical protein n=1 Tax=Roseovarius atlanticus TaxID=1641875 RepID=UPI001C96E24F|nr:hypothetical protein [Roseovarius atlanticus]MBY5989311.1 hypothetical protein [Roseovarius atlanticus]MBY6124703.1 hypothetical protein [Roseovarius atlanticus]MBY6149198.1 hypothetical protein [Roseovarius atlanticus]